MAAPGSTTDRPRDPLPPVVSGRSEAAKLANFPKNEHWRSQTIGDSIVSSIGKWRGFSSANWRGLSLGRLSPPRERELLWRLSQLLS